MNTKKSVGFIEFSLIERKENIERAFNLIPDVSDTSLLLSLFIIPIAVQWWAVWYPGSEPGGGGYIAQRMLAAKDEQNAVGASLLFNIAHYAVRPWPWIIVALASVILYPDLASIKAEFPNIKDQYLGDDKGCFYLELLVECPKIF